MKPLEDSFYLHCYSSNAQIGTEAVDILIIIGEIASHLDTIVKMYLETYERAKQRYDSGKRNTSELIQKINVLKSQLEIVPLKKKKKR